MRMHFTLQTLQTFNFITSLRPEPSSRKILIGEQPNPSQLLHQEDILSRHRGAELHRRYGRLGATSLFIFCL